MERNPKKTDEKKPDKTKDRGDKSNLLVKVCEDLEIVDFLPNRDRGDTKANLAKRSSRNLNSEKQASNHKGISNGGKKNNLEITVSEVKTKNPECYVLDSDDSSKNEHHVKVHKQQRKKLEESKAKTALSTIKNVHKTKIENKARVHSEQLIKLKPEIRRIDEIRRIEVKKIKINDDAHTDEEVKRTDKVKSLRFLPPGKDLKFIEKDALERRKLLREKYTVKLKSSSKNVESKDSFKTDDYEQKASETFDREKLNETKDIQQLIDGTRLTKKSKEAAQSHRRPIIKTIKNNDHRVYKAVTFIDQKEVTPLQIKMPISKKSVETNTVKNKLKTVASKYSEQSIIIETPNAKKNTKAKRRLRKRPSSPALATCQASPQTEVAKWAPSSFTEQTKPYYEAWVDTTLAAIAKCSEKDKLQFNKQHIMRTFKRAFELDSRPSSPDLIYEKVSDEKYMGKITVNKAK